MVLSLPIIIHSESPGQAPTPAGKRPGTHFGQMNGKRPLPGKRPGIFFAQ